MDEQAVLKTVGDNTLAGSIPVSSANDCWTSSIGRATHL